MKKRSLIIITILIVAIAASGALFLYVRDTPRYSLYQLKRALVARDMERAFNYIDLEHLTNAMTTAMFGKLDTKETKQESTDNSRSKDMLRQLLPSLKTTFKEQAKDQLLAYLSDEKTITSIDEATVWAFEIQRTGDTATVFLQNKPLFIMKRTTKGHWQIAEIIFKKT